MKKLLSTLLVLTLFIVTAQVAFAEPVDITELDADTDELLLEVEKATEVDDLKLDDAVQELEELDDETKEQEVQEKSRIVRIAEIIIEQIEMRLEFAENTKKVYKLSKEIKDVLKQTKRELNDIRTNPDREVNGQDFDDIKYLYKKTKNDIKSAEYTVGNIAKQITRYAKYVRNREFVKANATFKNILKLQKQQIEFVELILEDAGLILNRLQEV